MPVLIIFLFSDIASYSQEVKLLAGKIWSDSIPPSGIHVVNLDQESGTTSNALGEFKIYAGLGDRILFSSVQFENQQVIINNTLYTIGRIEVKLYSARNELDEIRISDLKLSGYLDKDVSRVKIFDRTRYGIPHARERPGQIERHLYTATTSSGGIPLDLLLNSINGKIAMLKKAKANDEMSNAVGEGLNSVGKDLFISELQVPEQEVINFIYYCSADPEFSRILDLGNNLELIEYFKIKVNPFKELREID